MKEITISEELAQQLIQYLAAQKWVEVNELITKLQVSYQQSLEKQEVKDGTS